MFKYLATDPQGRFVDGVLDAASERAVVDELRRKKLFAVSVVAADQKRTARGGSRSQAIALYARTLASVVGAGISLDRALDFAAEQSSNEEVKRAGMAVHDAVEQGTSLASAFAAQPVFGPVFVAMVTAGEESGALDESLAQLADHLDEMSELRSQVKTSLMYPALVGLVSAGAVALLLLFVIPRFAEMVQDEGARLPWTTRTVVAMSSVAWIILPALLIAAFALRDRLKAALFGSIEEEFNVAQFTRTLGMLLRGGRPLVAAMQTASSTVVNASMAGRLSSASDAVANGSTVRNALSGTLPPLATEMLAVGEESGRLDEMCLRVADAFESSFKRSLRALVAVLEPILIVFMAGVVGFVALAMLQAIYSINRSMF